MGTKTGISWTDHTFNPWRGCVKVSPGCANCYAERQSHRNPGVLGEWGPGSKRVIAAEGYWRQPLAWNRQAHQEGRRHRVFCASLADVFEDHPDLVAPRRRLFQLIAQAQQLDWQLLTKRPEDITRLWPAGVAEIGPRWWPHVWLVTSVENQEYADRRIPELLRVPTRVRGLSIEPLLGPVDLSAYLPRYTAGEFGPDVPGSHLPGRGIDWVIIGGESGPRARPCHLEWARNLVRQCRAAGVAVFVKQLGSQPRGVWPGQPKEDGKAQTGWRLGNSKGGNPEEWPVDLRIREFPGEVAHA